MAITIELPGAIEEKLPSEGGDIAALGKEVILIELYREGRISHGDLAGGLGLSRNQVDAVRRVRHIAAELPCADRTCARSAVAVRTRRRSTRRDCRIAASRRTCGRRGLGGVPTGLAGDSAADQNRPNSRPGVISYR